MATRKVSFVNGEFYHVYNRGVDKRNIFSEKHDLERFFQCMDEFNTTEPIGSLYENSFRKSEDQKIKKLVNVVCYCLNPNHYHMLLEQVAERGIEKFMHKLSTGHTRHFNEKNQRSGSLFQGTFKAVHIDSNEYLLHVSSYINLNYQVHQLSGLATKLVKSSWKEYTDPATDQFCTKNIILDQFDSLKEYEKYAQNSVQYTLSTRNTNSVLNSLLLEE